MVPACSSMPREQSRKVFASSTVRLVPRRTTQAALEAVTSMTSFPETRTLAVVLEVLPTPMPCCAVTFCTMLPSTALSATPRTVIASWPAASALSRTML